MANDVTWHSGSILILMTTIYIYLLQMIVIFMVEFTVRPHRSSLHGITIRVRCVVQSILLGVWAIFFSLGHSVGVGSQYFPG